LKKEGKYIPLVDDHSVQASRMFSTVAATVDEDDSDDAMPAFKQASKKCRVGPTLEDSDEDDGKPAAMPVAKNHRALCSSNSALVPLERPLESGPPVPERPVPPVAAMPPEAARAAVQKGCPAGLRKMSTPWKGAKKMQSKSGRRSWESNEEEHYISLEKGNQKGAMRKKYRYPKKFELELFKSMMERDMNCIMSD